MDVAKLSREAVEHIYRRLRGLRDGEVRPVAGELAAHYGVSPQSIYRAAARRGLRWRREHRDKGASRASDAAILQAGALMYAARRTSRDFPLPACDAVEMLRDSGIEVGVSTARAVSLLRERQMSARDLRRPAPHADLLSAHPNHVWQFDVTNCLQYFLEDRGGRKGRRRHGAMKERDLEMALYKNRLVQTARTIRKELLRYVAVDHCTGAFYFRYFYASGETARDGGDFLYEAMRPKDELIARVWNGASGPRLGKYRFHGVPFVLVADRGSITRARKIQGLLDALRIELRPHLPGNPRAKGAVEGLMKIINRFEARLRFRRPSGLAQLNEWALDWCIMYNALKSMRGSAPRSALWSRISDCQLRLCPEEKLFRALIREPVLTPRASGSCVISVDGAKYRVPDPHAARQRVTVVRHAYEHPMVEAHFNGRVWLLAPIGRDSYGRLEDGVPYGEYRSHRQTVTERAKKDMEAVAGAWGLSWKGTGGRRRAEAPPAGHDSPLNVFGRQAEKVPAPLAFLKCRGTELDVRQPEVRGGPRRSDALRVDREIAGRRMTFMQFLARLRGETGRIPPELNAQLRERFGGGVTEEEARELIRQLREGRSGPDKDGRMAL